MSRIDFTRMVTAEVVARSALAAAQAEAVRVVTMRLDQASLTLAGSVPLAEQLTWQSKELAAEAVLKGKASIAQTALLQDEADFTGETLDDLAETILARAKRFRVAVARLAGLRRQIVFGIEGCTSPKDIDPLLVELDAKLAAID